MLYILLTKYLSRRKAQRLVSGSYYTVVNILISKTIEEETSSNLSLASAMLEIEHAMQHAVNLQRLMPKFSMAYEVGLQDIAKEEWLIA